MQALRNFLNAAFYTRNTPVWERVLRFVVSVGLVAAAFLPGVGAGVAVLLAGSGLGLVATASTGFCPACYFAGRRIHSRRRAS